LGGDDVSTTLHESSHAAAAITLGRPVDWIWRTAGLEVAGDVVGKCRAPVGDQIGASQVAVCLVGYLSEGEPGWPPPWPDCLSEPRERLGLVLSELGVTERIYRDMVELTRDMLADPRFIRLRDAIARALEQVPHLEREDIEALCRVTNTPIPKETPA
jgi:hypothetical protein